MRLDAPRSGEHRRSGRERPGWQADVRRSQLLRRLEVERPDIVIVVAPAGYGKSTLLDQWLAADDRVGARCVLDGRDNDPDRLVERLIPFTEVCSGDGPPFLVVLDDVHTLTSRPALAVVKSLAARVPLGSTLAVAGRSVPDLLLGMTRARRQVTDIDLRHLAFDVDETGDLCRSMGLELVGRDELHLLVDRTEGWPAALHLAIRGALEADDPHRFLAEFAGDDTYFAELLHDELIDGLPRETTEFLLAASSLERMSGPLCDEALGRSGSALLLERLARETLLVIPLDRRRTWYRFHRMLHRLLHAEHGHRGGAAGDDIRRKASIWYEGQGDVDAAIECAALAHDTTRATDLVLEHFSARASRGAPEVVEAWLTFLTDVRLPSNPSLDSVAALVRMGLGDPSGAIRSLRRAEFGLPERYPADGPFEQPAACVAALRALLGRVPPDLMREDAGYARRHTTSPVWYAIASLADGASSFMVGDIDVAAETFHDGVAHAETCNFTSLAVLYAHLAILADVNRDPGEALRLARQAKQVVTDYALEAVPHVCLAQIVSAWLELRAGHDEQAFADRSAGRTNLARCGGLGPWAQLQAFVALAHFDRIRGDHAGKLAWLDEAEAVLLQVPDAVMVKDQVAEVRRQSRPAGLTGSPGALSSLSGAELRVLQYLPTHLRLTEIADQLYLSRHTVKSHVMSMYRKLGTSSRNETVELAVRSGLVADAAASSPRLRTSTKREP